MTSSYVRVQIQSPHVERYVWESGPIVSPNAMHLWHRPDMVPILPESSGKYSYKVDMKEWNDGNKRTLSNSPYEERLVVSEFAVVARTPTYKRVNFIEWDPVRNENVVREFAIKAEPLSDLDARVIKCVLYVLGMDVNDENVDPDKYMDVVAIVDDESELMEDDGGGVFFIYIGDWREGQTTQDETHVLTSAYVYKGVHAEAIPAHKWLKV